MENNIGDFFRKRLNEDMSNEDWANPDMEIDIKVLNQISHPIKSISKVWRGIILKSCIGFLLLLMGSSIIYLNQELSVAKNKLIDRSDLVVNNKFKSNIQNNYNAQNREAKDSLVAHLKAENEILILENEKLNQLNKQLKLETVKNHSENDDLNKILREEKEILLNENLRLIQLTEQLSNEQSTLKAQLNKQKLSYTQILKDNNQFKDSISLLSSILTEKINLETEKSSKEDIIYIKEKSAHYKRFTVGYEYSRQNWNMPISRTFAEQRLVSESGESNVISSNVHGLNFAFSPKQSWLIRSGLRFTQLNGSSSYVMGLAYSPINERPDPNSVGTINTLSVTTNSLFFTSDNSVNVLFEPDDIPEAGSLLEYRVEDNLSISSWQMPIGLERQFNTGKTFFFVHGGVQFNSIRIKNYTSRSSILDSDQNPLDITRESLDAQNTNNRLFMNIYGELGIEQPIFRKWYLRTAINYSYNFLKNNVSDIANQSKTGTAFRLGLNYRF